MNNALKGLQPEKVFMFFEELTQIPHGSHNTDQQAKAMRMLRE